MVKDTKIFGTDVLASHSGTFLPSSPRSCFFILFSTHHLPGWWGVVPFAFILFSPRASFWGNSWSKLEVGGGGFFFLDRRHGASLLLPQVQFHVRPRVINLIN